MPDTSPQPHLRFSLLWVLVLTTTVAFAAAFGAALKQNIELRDEIDQVGRKLDQVRNDLGTLSIHDPNALHIIEADLPDSNMWRWKVYVPLVRTWYLHAATEFPMDGLPEASHEPISLGWVPQTSISLQVGIDKEGAQGLYLSTDEHYAVRRWLPPRDSRSVLGRFAARLNAPLGKSQVVLTASESGELLRIHDRQKTEEGRASGLLVWISPSKERLPR